MSAALNLAMEFTPGTWIILTLPAIGNRKFVKNPIIIRFYKIVGDFWERKPNILLHLFLITDMKYVKEFRDPDKAQGLVREIAQLSQKL